MRIARIIEYFPPHIGGMEGHGLNLSVLQKNDLRCDVEIFIGYGEEHWYKKWGLSEHYKNNIETYKMLAQSLPLYSKKRRICFNFWACSEVEKIHKKNPYDIIHLHGDFIEAYFGGKLSKKLKIPAVLTIHAGLNRRFLKPILKLICVYCFRNIDKIICVSEEIKNDLKSIGIPENKLIVISSGINLIEFKDENINKNEIVNLQKQYSKKPIIISVGALRVNKGFEYLIEAFKLVKKEFNSATLLIIGSSLRVIAYGSDQKDEEREKLEAQTKGMTDIYFLGRQDHKRVIEYLKISDVFVLASISTRGDREGTSNSIMDAMAAGLPVVATKVGGTPYLIKENQNGLLVEEKNSKTLAQAIKKIITDENLRRQMSEQNLEDIKQKDWPVIAKQITDVYPRK